MSLQWVTPCDATWASKSTNGYYAISREHPGEFMAHHIEALWARPDEIGLANTLAGAQDICSQHSRREPAPV